MMKKLSRGGRALAWLGCLLALILLASCADGWGYEIEREGAEEEVVTEEERGAEEEMVTEEEEAAPGGGEFVTDAGCELLQLATKDSYYNDLDAIYALEDKGGGRLVRIPLEPGEAVTYLGAVAEDESTYTLTIHEGIAYWRDNENIYYMPTCGGTVTVVDSGTIIEGPLVINGAWVYFVDWIWENFVLIPLTGGEAELFDESALGAMRSMARDPTTIYWIGADDGTVLRSMPSGRGPWTTILSGIEYIDWPWKLKAVPGPSGTALYWLDKVNDLDVVRTYQGGSVYSVMSSEFIYDYAVTDDAIYWLSPIAPGSYIGRFDLATQEFTYPVVTEWRDIDNFGIHGDYIYYSIDGEVYRVPLP